MAINADHSTYSEAADANGYAAGQACRRDRFLVCGLGRLGQHCVETLQTFASEDYTVDVVAIDRAIPNEQPVANVLEMLAEPLILGDCRLDYTLEKARIQNCRAILIVTSDEDVNIETAIAARQLNPDLRLVVRSSQENLNELLKQELANFTAFNPTDLPVNTLMLAALGQETLGMIDLKGRRFRVMQEQVKPGDYRFDNAPVEQLHRRNQRLLNYPSAREQGWQPWSETPLRAFHQWAPDAVLKAGDTIVYIKEVEPPRGERPATARRSQPTVKKWLQRLQQIRWRHLLNQFWKWLRGDSTRQVIAVSVPLALSLATLGTLLLKLNVPGITWSGAISNAIVLLLGGYGDVFGGLLPDLAVPWWVQYGCLAITVVSLIYLLGVLGLVADRLLSSRFAFLRRLPPIPTANHVVIVGLGRVGHRVTERLRELAQPIVCLTQNEQPDFWPDVPVLIGPIIKNLAQVNLAQARSVVMVSGNQMLNLEVALMARSQAAQAGRSPQLVIRTYDQRFSNHLDRLLPNAHAFCVYAISAQAFAGAAFGENILTLFQLHQETILVTEYRIEVGDTLNGKILAEVAYGYGVVPVLHQSSEHTHWMPQDDIRLKIGDRLVVLATINGLRRVELGALVPPRRWQLQAMRPLNLRALHYAGDILENVSGCSLKQARQFMASLSTSLDEPRTLVLPLYDHQAYRLQRRLGRLLPVTLTPIDSLQS